MNVASERVVKHSNLFDLSVHDQNAEKHLDMLHSQLSLGDPTLVQERLNLYR